MATVNLATQLNSGLPPSVHMGRMPIAYKDVLIDFAAAVTAKGSALAASDIIQAINVPAQSVVLAAGLEVITAVGGSVTVLTVGLGTTTAASNFVTGYNLFAGVAGDYAPMNSAAYPLVVNNTAGTVDITISTLTNALTSGVVRVWALFGDTIDQRAPGLAQLKS